MKAPTYKSPASDLMLRLCRGVVAHSNAKIHHLMLMDSNGVPFHQPIHFILKCPDEGVICPITQEPITSVDEALPFDLDYPDRTSIKLACQHDFCAFWLIYNWVHNNNVRCPLCRAGPSNARIDVARMPPHVRVSVQRHMRKTVQVMQESDAVHAALVFIETVAGKSYLDQFPEQCIEEFIDRLECKRGVSRGEKVMVLSNVKSKVVFSQFVSWYRCDPVKYTSNIIQLDMDQSPDNFDVLLPLTLVLEMLKHVMTVMYGMSFWSRYDHDKRSYAYTILPPADQASGVQAY